MEHDVLACPACGLVLEAVQAQLDEAERTVRQTELALRGERAKVSAMRADRNGQEKMDPLYGEAERVFDYWKRKLVPGAKEFSGQRLAAVMARLRGGASVEELCEAVDGCAARPYVSDHGRSPHGLVSQKEVELELICRSESHLDRFRRYALGTREADTAGMGQLQLSARTVEVPKLDEAIVERARAELGEPIRDRLHSLRGWTADALERLEIGFDRRSGRIVFPIRDGANVLVGVCRHAPNPERRNGTKMLAEGLRDLFPPPETIDTESIWLVEGEPDAVAMWSIGYPATAIPGTGKWRDEWVLRFRGFERVRILFDCDEEGRTAAAARQKALSEVADVSVVDLDPKRTDRYDVGDLVRERGEAAATVLTRLSNPSYERTIHRLQRRDQTPPYRKVVDALEAKSFVVKEVGDGRAEAQCPLHGDRNPSMSITEGDDGRVLLHCHAGCETEAIVAELGLAMRELFAAA